MYQDYLNTENAQKIADGIMKIIPCNINLTDTEGVILTSGDKSRLGSLHQGALTALEQKESYVVYEKTATEQRGINLPIFYNNSILGVIAINGDVEEVMPNAVLMIENRLLSDMSAIKESRLKDFLYEWISLSQEQYDDAFYDQAAYLGINLKIPRTAVIITIGRICYSVIVAIKNRLDDDEYIVRQGLEEVLVLFASGRRLEKRLEKIMEISRDLIPAPIVSAHPEWIESYDYAMKVLYSNIHQPAEGSGFVSNFVDAAFNDDIFMWDTVFMTLFCNLFHPYVPGICSLDNFYCKQFDDGEIPREMIRDTGKDFLYWVNAFDSTLYSYFHNHYGFRILKDLKTLPYEDMYKPNMGRIIEKKPYLTLDNLNHPLLAFAEWESYCHTRDVERLHLVVEPLYHYYEAMKYHLRHQNGLYVTDWASMDNSPRNKHLGLAVDTSSEMVLFAGNLIEIMDLLVKKGYGVCDYETRREGLVKDRTILINKINHYMWNEQDGFYYDLTFEERQSRIKTIAGFFPLVCGVADEKQGKRLIEWLEDKETFNRVHRIPVLAADEEGYDPRGGYWRGSVWAPTNALVIGGLEKHGFHKLTKDIAINHQDVIAKVFRDAGTIWENYPPDEVSSGDSDNQDFVGWSGLGPILYLIQYAVGLSLERNTDKVVLRWEISRPIRTRGLPRRWKMMPTRLFMERLQRDTP